MEPAVVGPAVAEPEVAAREDSVAAEAQEDRVVAEAEAQVEEAGGVTRMDPDRQLDRSRGWSPSPDRRDRSPRRRRGLGWRR